jgi:hypothetical protein
MIVGIGLAFMAIIPASISTHVADREKSGVERKPVVAMNAQNVGRITGMVDCRWAGSDKKPRNGDRVQLGQQYSLSSGLLEITYETGAKVILQGPVTYDVESTNGGLMSIGKLTGRVENPKAKGFAVRTPTAIVTDLGTEFGIEVHENHASDVYVISGKVDVATRQGHHHQLLQAEGGAMRAARVETINGTGQYRIVSVVINPTKFAKITPHPIAIKPSRSKGERILIQSRFDLSSEGWMTTAGGNGVSYARQDGHPGGCIETRQSPANTDCFYFSASPRYSGNLEAAFGGRLHFDVFTTFATPPKYSIGQGVFMKEPPIAILGSHKNRIAVDLSFSFNADQWIAFSIPLDATGKWYRIPLGELVPEDPHYDRTPVDDKVIREVLTNLTDMWIRAEYWHGDDIGRLDNVQFVAPKSPVSKE